MVLPREHILPRVTERVKPVSPVAVEVEPFRRGGRSEFGGVENVRGMIVIITEDIKCRVPERPPICLIVQQTEREDIRMEARGSVHSMSANGRINDGSLADFLHGVIRVGLAEVVFAEEDEFRFSVVEADEGVFPVADVVAEADVEDEVAEVVAVEEEPEGVDDAVAFVDHDEDCGGVAAAAVDLTVAVGADWALVHTICALVMAV